MRRNKIISLILVIVMLLSTTVYYVSAEDGVPSWAEEAVTTWRNNGWLDNGTFDNGAVSRGEFVKWLCGAFGIYNETPDLTNNPFTDVTSDNAYYKWLLIANQKGLVLGTSATTASPEALITRQDIATIIGRAEEKEASLPIADLSKLDKFSDKNETADYAKSYLARCVEYGYLQGYDDGTVRPNNNMTRAEAIVMLSRVLNKHNGTDQQIGSSAEGNSSIGNSATGNSQADNSAKETLKAALTKSEALQNYSSSQNMKITIIDGNKNSSVVNTTTNIVMRTDPEEMSMVSSIESDGTKTENDCYLVNESGTKYIYMGCDGSWLKYKEEETDILGDLEMSFTQINDISAKISSLIDKYSVTSMGTETVKSGSSAKYKVTIPADSFNDITSVFGVFLADYNSVSTDTNIYFLVDDATGYISGIEINYPEDKVLTASSSGVECAYYFYDFNKTDRIVLPEEAKNASEGM